MAGLSVYDGILRPDGGLVTPQSSVDDMYRGIYPAAQPARTTSEGLAVRGVQTVAVDPFTGDPIHAGGTTAPATAAVLSRDPGRLTASPAAVQRPPANYGAADLAYVDQGPKVIVRSVNPDGSYSDPLTAIEAVAPTTASVPMPRRRPEPSRSAYLSGDPGVTNWDIANQGGAGLGGPLNAHSIIPASAPPTRIPSYAGGAPTVRSVIAARNAAPAPVTVISPEVHAALMAQQSADQRGLAASQASGQVDQFGMVTGSGEKGQWH